MIEHRITLTDDELRTEAVQNNLPVLALAKFLRSLPDGQKSFFKDCRIAAVIPIYMPKGDFDAHMHAMRLDPDQIDWFLKQHPEFNVQDDTANNTLSTGNKVIVS